MFEVEHVWEANSDVVLVVPVIVFAHKKTSYIGNQVPAHVILVHLMQLSEQLQLLAIGVEVEVGYDLLG